MHAWKDRKRKGLKIRPGEITRDEYGKMHNGKRRGVKKFLGKKASEFRGKSGRRGRRKREYEGRLRLLTFKSQP